MYWCVIPCLEVCLRVVYSFEAFMIIYYSYFFHPPIFISFFSTTTTTTTTSNSNDSSNKHSKSIDPSHSFHTPTHPAPASSSLPHTTYLSTSSHPSPCPPSPSSTPSSNDSAAPNSFPNASPFASAASAAASSHFPATRSSRTPASSPRTTAAPPIPP